MTASYPGLHSFCLALSHSDSHDSSRGLLQDLNDLFFITQLLLFSIFHYHSINCHHYQSPKLVHAFSQPPEKNEEKGYQASRHSGRILGGGALTFSLHGKEILLGGSDKRTIWPLRHPQLFADLLWMETGHWGSYVFVDSGCTWLSSGLKYQKDFMTRQSHLSVRYLTYVPFPRPLKLPGLSTHQAAERHESIQKNNSYLRHLPRPPTHSSLPPITPSPLMLLIAFQIPVCAPGLPHCIGSLLRFQLWLNEQASSKG